MSYTMLRAHGFFSQPLELRIVLPSITLITILQPPKTSQLGADAWQVPASFSVYQDYREMGNHVAELNQSVAILSFGLGQAGITQVTPLSCRAAFCFSIQVHPGTPWHNPESAALPD